ncbi:MAG: signal peptidase I [Lachnospiraceae bacterium]|nr:signal peptidase I [Lachnospiraceae bacterium]
MWFRDLIDKIKKFFEHRFSRGLNFQRRRRRFKIKEVQTIAINVGIVVLVVLISFLLVFTFFTSVKMAGVSMKPTIEDNTNLLINRGSYLIFKPSHNHIVAFKSLSNEQDTTYVKRIVGVPGDKITIKSGRLYVNGEKYDDVADTEAITYKGIVESELTLGNDEYFVLGDNRNNSEDSRYPSIGVISKEQIKGKVWFKTSFGDFGIVN